MAVLSPNIGELLENIVDPSSIATQRIVPRAVVLDSRLIESGDMFVAVPGADRDGRDYVPQALAAGASSVLAEAEGLALDDPRVIAIPNLRAYCGEIARRFYRNPSRDMAITAVTGTNGKTSITDYIAQLLRLLGQPAGIIGTLGSRLVSSEVTEAANTTPDIFTLNQTLSHWRDESIRHVALEASSHALDQGRMDGLNLHTGVFTNLTRDHLDYHGSFDAYCDAKLSLFRDFDLHRAVYNADDDMSAKVATVSRCPTVGVSLTNASADVFVALESQDASGLSVRMHSPYGSEQINLALHGHFNAFNVAAAIVSLSGMGFSFSKLCSAAQQLEPVSGRMEVVASDDLRVVVDYSHTPDSLQRALQALRASMVGQLWVVFGCGGDRDAGKRAMMGQIAEDLADCVIVTNDNPRSESPERIAADIASGCTNPPTIELDRAKAIHRAIVNAQPGDTVLVAGKGHESYQLIGEQRHPFSDLDVAREAIATRGGA